MKVVVIGTGAIGSFYAGKLAQAGADISLICRSDYDIVKKEGIFVESIDGDFHFTPNHIYRSASEITESPDVVLVALKVLPTIDPVALIRPIVGPNTTIFLIQNGIDIESPFQKAFPQNEIISAIAFICCSRKKLGHVWHQDFGRIKFGPYPKGQSDRSIALGKLFKTSGVEAEVCENMLKARWEKLIWNAPFNPISAFGNGLSTKEMLNDSSTYELCELMMQEVVKISEAIGEPLDSQLITNNLNYTKEMEPYYTSMCLDFQAKRPIEVDAILGNAIAVAKKLGVDVPHMFTVYTLLRMIDKKNRE